MIQSRRVQIILLCLLAPLVLASCGDEVTPAMRIEQLEGLPLWHKGLAVALIALVSDDLAGIAAGILASEGLMPFGWGLFAALLGTYLSNLPIYLVARLGGIQMLRKRPFRWLINEAQLLQAEDLFRSHAVKLIFTSRILPGSRFPIYAAAGVLNYPFWKFLFYLLLAGGLSTLILVWGSMRLGEVVFEWLRVYEAYALPIVIGVVVVIWIVVKALEILATRRSRLLFLARWRKLLGRARRARPRA
jgi:membrane protein DedA with SNARE-associated domain